MNTTTRLVVRMTPEEKAALLQKAKQAGLTPSEFVWHRLNETGVTIEEERRTELEVALTAIDAAIPQIIRSLDNAIAVAEALNRKIDSHGARLTRIESTIEILRPDGSVLRLV